MLVQPSRRVVLLGASNLTRAFPTVVATVRQTWSEPIDLMVAMGHGRSYGQDSWVLGRKISGIFPCALWRDLQTRSPLPTSALMTDIGNDLLYGTSPEQLADWVQKCVDRLAETGAATIVTQTPTESLERLGERRFLLFKRLFFPRSRLTLRDAVALAREVNERLLEFAESRKISVISASGSWYGFDPIHILRSMKHAAWPFLLAAWSALNEPLAIRRPSVWTSAYLTCLMPLERAQFGITLRTPQPCGRLNDGTTISLY
jgi:hypothetical protein